MIVSWALLLDALASAMARAAMPSFWKAKGTMLRFKAASCKVGLKTQVFEAFRESRTALISLDPAFRLGM